MFLLFLRIDVDINGICDLGGSALCDLYYFWAFTSYTSTISSRIASDLQNDHFALWKSHFRNTSFWKFCGKSFSEFLDRNFQNTISRIRFPNCSFQNRMFKLYEMYFGIYFLEWDFWNKLFETYIMFFLMSFPKYSFMNMFYKEFFKTH